MKRLIDVTIRIKQIIHFFLSALGLTPTPPSAITGGQGGSINLNPKSINIMYPIEWQRDSTITIKAQIYNINDDLYIPPSSKLSYNISGINLKSKEVDNLNQIVWTFEISSIAEIGNKTLTLVVEDQQSLTETLNVEIVEKIKKKEMDTDLLFLLYTIIGIIILLLILIFMVLRRKKEKRKSL